MEKPIEVVRDYTKPDDEMLEQSQGMHDAFAERKTVFVAKFPSLDDPFATDWQDEIDVCHSFSSDAANRSALVMQTQKLDDEMKAGRDVYQTLLLYVKLAWPGDAAMLNVFGQNLYKEVNRSQTRFPDLLGVAYAQATQAGYKSLLTVKGLTETSIERLKTIKETIESDNRQQQNLKSSRGLSTQERIKRLNKVWSRMTMVSECAKEAFKDDYAQYRLFLLYPEGGPTPPAPPKTQ